MILARLLLGLAGIRPDDPGPARAEAHRQALVDAEAVVDAHEPPVTLHENTSPLETLLSYAENSSAVSADAETSPPEASAAPYPAPSGGRPAHRDDLALEDLLAGRFEHHGHMRPADQDSGYACQCGHYLNTTWPSARTAWWRHFAQLQANSVLSEFDLSPRK